MQNKRHSMKTAVSRSLVLTISMLASSAHAVDLNYEGLSSLEEPIAFDYGDVTFSFTGLADAATIYLDSSDDTDTSFLANFQLTAETQLANSWTLGAAYFGQYDEVIDDYTDNAALFLGGVWGTGFVGNVTGSVREQTRRIRGAGNAELAFDDHLGQLSDTGIAYIGRFGPSQLVSTVDDDGGFEIGGVFQRPIGNKDYRFSIRYRDSEFTAGNANTFDSQALGLVAELTYGSSVFDLGLGYEELSNNALSVDRQYVSIGASRKIGRFTFSGEAHFGEIEGESETSYALGLRTDIARGLSLNLGVNDTDAIIDVDGVSFLDDEDLEARLSLRYSF